MSSWKSDLSLEATRFLAGRRRLNHDALIWTVLLGTRLNGEVSHWHYKVTHCNLGIRAFLNYATPLLLETMTIIFFWKKSRDIFSLKVFTIVKHQYSPPRTTQTHNKWVILTSFKGLCLIFVVIDLSGRLFAWQAHNFYFHMLECRITHKVLFSSSSTCKPSTHTAITFRVIPTL